MTRADFDYSPATIRASVNRSLERLHTSYLDAVYLHDVEFVCDSLESGGDAAGLNCSKEAYDLGGGQESIVRGDGDRVILDGIAELWRMKDEGLIRSVGITGES